MSNPTVIIDTVPMVVEGEKNLLELIRKAGIELPTFCYHTEISVYGACRMCMVEVEGRGIVPACSTNPEDGMVVRTSTRQIRAMRKMIIELMLASHDDSCTTCPKARTCRLLSISEQLGVKKIRFERMDVDKPIDLSSPSVVRSPSKCILCGDCVRYCSEIQAVGALDFAYRGAQARVETYSNRSLSEVECVYCGQCIKVCPVGALTIRTNITSVWEEIFKKDKIVVAQIAPAVRVALGELFGEEPGVNNMGKIASALRLIGFDRVYDMCYGADFTVVEEGKEFLKRYEKGENLPLFTSCCPSWVKFAEQFYPRLLNNLSTAKSPMQMFGALCKDQLTRELGVPREQIVVVCIAPCTAKKFEAKRPEFEVDGNPDVDHVMTTDELARMMNAYGIKFDVLESGPLDMPLSFSTGGAVIFGSTGGVSEAVLRFAARELEKGPQREFKQFRGSDGIKTGEIKIGDKTLRLGVVSGLSNAKILINKVLSGEESYDLIEVMACPGGCVNGGGQPVHFHNDNYINAERASGLYNRDRSLQFHVSSENPILQKLYSEYLDDHKAHELLHTGFESRRRFQQDDFVLSKAEGEQKLGLTICFGRSCFLNGAQDLYSKLMAYLNETGLNANTEFKARFCAEKCGKGPVLEVNGTLLERCTIEKAVEAIEAALA